MSKSNVERQCPHMWPWSWHLISSCFSFVLHCNNSSYFIKLLWGLNDTVYVKCHILEKKSASILSLTSALKLSSLYKIKKLPKGLENMQIPLQLSQNHAFMFSDFAAVNGASPDCMRLYLAWERQLAVWCAPCLKC